MKRVLLKSTTIVLSLLIAMAAQAAEKAVEPTRSLASDMPPVVQQEYSKTQQSLSSELSRLKSSLHTLRQQKSQAMAQSRTAMKMDELGVKTLQDYQLLLIERHTDDRGDFQPGSEIAAEEIETLNKLFNAFLTMVPFQKRVSAGQAKKQLEWAIDRLKDLSKVHGDPSESNNSELQIIAKQVKDAEAAEKRLLATAEKLNFKLTVTSAPRMPASNAAVSTPATNNAQGDEK